MIDLKIPETKFALYAVYQAMSIVGQVQSELVTSALTKDDRSPVTVADFASQALIARLLEEAFPDDALVGEEDSKALRSPDQGFTLDLVTQFVSQFLPQVNSEKVCAWIDRGKSSPSTRFWTLDPIDGTKGFLRGDQYAVALALIVDGQVQLGVLGCPNLSDGFRPDHDGRGSLVVASRGGGTWVTPADIDARALSAGAFERLSVSQRSDPSQARILRSFEAGHTNVGQIDEIARVLGVTVEPVRMDSQAKYAVLAAGKGDLMLRLLSPAKPNYREKIWDQAAGSLVVEEAGGRTTDLHGERLDFNAGRTLENNRGILASNGRLHPAALGALRAVGA
jgi:3'(2'), 5'-bisphosphate nucleotidase